jgi:hypothetical protein
MAINTIMHNFENLNLDKTKSAQLILKFNSELKKLGFKKAVLDRSDSERINPDTIKEGLTIYFNPSFRDINSTERQYFRDSYAPISNYLNSLGGSGHSNYHYALRSGNFEEQISLKIKYENKKYVIGDYLPNRNVVIIYFYPFLENWTLNKDNKYIIQLLDWIKEVVKEYDIKEQDINKLKDKIFIAKYTKVINNQISNLINETETCEIDIENYKPRITECYNKITINKVSVENLKKMTENIKEGLLNKLEEIKKLKFVKKVELTHEGISLEFEKIFIKVKGEDIEMGEYIITLTPNNIKIINKEPVVFGGTTYHSCHINDRTICFGKENTLAYELLGKLELKKLTHFLYLYLKSYNPEDTYISMNYWIKGKENGGVVPNDTDEDEERENYCNSCGDYFSDDNFNFDRGMCLNCCVYEDEHEGEE